MRALLVQPDSKEELIGWGDLGAIAEPLALEYIAAAARLDGHEVALLDLRLHPGTLAGTLAAWCPDVVGVTGYSMHVLRMREICAEVKRLVPGCRTIVGGHHATLLPEDFFDPAIDAVVVGEGCGPIRGILRGFESGGSAAGLSGVWSRGADGQFIDGGPPAPFSPEDLPLPERSLALHDRASYFIDWMRPIALMRNTVGCPYRCNFCSLWRIMDGRYYKRELDRVVEELATIEETSVFLVDDEAFVDAKRMHRLAEAILAAGLDKRFFTYCRIDTLLRHRELMALWRRAGLERLFIGIETVTDEGLSAYEKRLSVAQVEEGLRVARELGIAVFAGFIVHPSWEAKDFVRLERFIQHNQVDYPSCTIWTPLPGTDALASFDSVIERQSNGRPNWELFDLQHPVIETRLPRAEFMRRYHGLHRTFSPLHSQYRDIGAALRRREMMSA